MLAFGPGPRAEHRRRSFMPHRDDIGNQMQAVFHASEGRCRYVGSWHSHPLGRAIPSQLDTRTAADIAAQADVLLPTPVLLINATLPVLRSRVSRIQAFKWVESTSVLLRAELRTVTLDIGWAPAELTRLAEGAGGH